MKKSINYLVTGFTLIELVVTLAIIVIVFSITVSRTNRMSSRSNINLAAESLISNLRSTAVSALNAEQFQLQTPTSWGIKIQGDSVVRNPKNQTDHIVYNPTILTDFIGKPTYAAETSVVYSYTIFADLNGNRVYDTNEKFKTVILGNNIKINYVGAPPGDLYPEGSIAFNVPDAKTYFEANEISSDKGYIEIELEDVVTGDRKHISINSLGTVNSD